MKIYIPLTIGILTVVLLLAFAFGQGQAQDASPVSGRTDSSDVDARSSYIPIQGRLTDASGNPLTGTYDVTFRLYDEWIGGAALCQSIAPGTSVENGLFIQYIDMAGCAAIDGRQLYLGLQVGSDAEMTPRQFIDNVPYAWTLRPGANISSTIGGDATLDIDNYSPTGRGLRSEAQSASGVNYAVLGASKSIDGFGGYFYNNGGGVGLYASTSSTNNFSVIGMQEGYSADDYTKPNLSGAIFGGINGVIGISHDNGLGGAGVYGWAQATSSTSYGVYGETASTNGSGVYGFASTSTGPNFGVQGYSASTEGRGVSGYASATSGTTYGVYGKSASPSGRGVYGQDNNISGGIGVQGRSEVGSGVYGNSTSGYGVYGNSTSGYGVYGNTSAAGNNYGIFTPDNLYSLNYHLTGAIMQVVQNGGEQALEEGDLVVFSGIVVQTEADESPMIQVSKATTANDTAIAGVVYSAYSMEGAELDGAVQPGESLLVVVQGPARVKVSAAAEAIQVGDLLSSSGQAGFAAHSAEVTLEGVQTSLPGTVFAKALETLESGEGWIYVYVTLK